MFHFSQVYGSELTELMNVDRARTYTSRVVVWIIQKNGLQISADRLSQTGGFVVEAARSAARRPHEFERAWMSLCLLSYVCLTLFT
jgi:hypothetical protein